jgi:nicotinate-nucleotide pyrophosphorylase (carboxylating)
MVLDPSTVFADVSRALAEDIGAGDVTAQLIPASRHAEARVISRDDIVLAGQRWFDAVFDQLDPNIQVHWEYHDGDVVLANSSLCELKGNARHLLSGERTALNFLQLLSATATTTRRYVDAVADTKARILDTRKTLPGLRQAQKYAVVCGGGKNHRLGLYDAILIKENHIAAEGSLQAAVATARGQQPDLTIEVEVETLAQLDEALTTSADSVLLDNFDLADLRRAVSCRDKSERPDLLLEASGGVDLTTVADIAATGIDFISVGALTKDVVAADLSMRFLGDQP